MKKIVYVFLLLMSIACKPDSIPEPSSVAVSSIKLNQTTVTLSKGETVALTATVLPENATDKTVTWSSSNTDIATVDNGKVKAISVGKTTIVAKAGNIKAECSVTVSPTEVTSIILSETALELYPGDVFELTATVLPEDAEDKTIRWQSTDTDVATVDDGKVTAVSVGTAKIVARIGNIRAECSVTVSATEVTSVVLNKTSLELYPGDEAELTVTISPEDATDKTVIWSSSDTDIATVNNGKVTAVSVGTATIAARVGGVEAECSVTVSPVEVISVTLNETSLELYPGDVFELEATVSPENATDKTIVWSSSDTDIATVLDGKVTALSVGTATIVAQAGNVQAECSITVNPVTVASVRLNKTSLELYPGDVFELIATVYPEEAEDKTITWSSSDTDIVTVENGVVTAVAIGTATINAQAGNYMAECKVTVNPIEVTSVSLNRESIELYPGDTEFLVATVLPDNATYKGVRWETSDSGIAMVDEYGMVTAVAPGTARIYARTADCYASCEVTVKPIDVTNLSFDKQSITMVSGGTESLSLTVEPSDATYDYVNWESSDPSVAVVENGQIVAYQAGTSVISANIGEAWAYCTVSVLPTSLSFSKTSITLNVGDRTEMTSYLVPAATPSSFLTWTSSAPDVVSVEDGVISALQKGKAAITVETTNGLSATCNVIVVSNPGAGGSEGTGEVEWN